MKADIKQLWVDALRSGEYKQGQGYLHNADRFCCLGVLCDLAIKNGVKVDVKVETHGATGEKSLVFYDDMDEILPASVSDWAGIDQDPSISTNTVHAKLAELNDTGESFSNIADLIEESL